MMSQRLDSSRTTATAAQIPICKNYVWGKCTKYDRCIYRHELSFPVMKEILRFCHDHQNSQGCKRENCSYIHVSKEEQNMFTNHGIIPPYLVARYSAIVANAPPNQTPYMGQMGLQFGQQMSVPPPPPPPAPRPLFAQPPPPPPPPPPHTTVPVHAAPPAALYTAPPPRPPPARAAPPARPAPLAMPVFDVSRPPPPTPASNNHYEASSSRPRPAPLASPAPPATPAPVASTSAVSTLYNATPSPYSARSCENCTRSQLRINMYKAEIETLQNDEESLSLSYKKKLDEFETGKDIMRRLVTPELFAFLDLYIEDPQPDMFSLGGAHAEPTQNLLELLLTNANSPSNYILKLMMETMLNRGSANAGTSSLNPDVLRLLMDLLTQSRAPPAPAPLPAPSTPRPNATTPHINPLTPHINPPTPHMNPATSHINPPSSHINPATSHINPPPPHVNPPPPHVNPPPPPRYFAPPPPPPPAPQPPTYAEQPTNGTTSGSKLAPYYQFPPPGPPPPYYYHPYR